MIINESALQFVSQPYIQNLVTKESCIAYIQDTAVWNTRLRIIAFVAVALMFYYMYKQGKFDGEKKLLQKVSDGGIGNNDDNNDNNDEPLTGGGVRETTRPDERKNQH
jgi:hypothetical protein